MTLFSRILRELVVRYARERPVIRIRGGVAHEDVDLSERAIGLFHEPAKIVLRGNVGGNGDCASIAVTPVDRVDDLLAGGRLARGNDHFRAVLREALDDRPANAPRGARDDGHSAGEIEKRHAMSSRE